MRGLFTPLLLCVVCATAVVCAPKTLDLWVIDTEGGKALLVRSPAGKSMLIDTGFPGNNERDTNRILEVCRLAGVERLDVLLTTHYDLDHVSNTPSLVAMMPVTLFVDHGVPVVSDALASRPSTRVTGRSTRPPTTRPTRSSPTSRTRPTATGSGSPRRTTARSS
jgi:glyoxylase-like metal-dependent hydrolase (beta-lactamase superfamily II)